MSSVGLILLLSFLFSLAVGIPIAASIAISCVLVILIQDLPLILLAQKMVNGANSFTLIAIPGFLLIGSLMTRSGIVERIIEFCMALIGWVRGGLSVVSMVGSMFFAGISGSGTADTAAVGSVMIPALQRAKYGASHSAAIVAAGGSIGIIIPPSIPMIIYGLSSGTAIPTLFMAGYLPGILLTLGFVVYLYLVSAKQQLGEIQTFSRAHVRRAFLDSFWALLAPVIIVGSILGGITTPTESAVIGVFYILILGFFVYRKLTLKLLYRCLEEAAVMSGVVMFILMTSNLFGWFIARENIPESLVSVIMSITENKYAILLLLNILLLFLGALMDTVALLIILTPVLLPLSVQLGIDPVHFGVMFVFNLSVGLLTPPVGYCLFVAASIGRVSIGAISRAILPFLAVAISILLLVTYLEDVALFLPRLTGLSN